jgi:hypothetical protein
VKLLLALAAVACGGNKPKVIDRVEADPEWAAGYEQRAHDGCDCKDAACLDRVHGELAKFEADHGGMDDAPPGVQKAHGEFDQCWRDGTKDPARDLEYAATQVCDCVDAACLEKWKIGAMRLADKYGVSDLDDVAKLAPSGPPAVARARKCITDATLPAAEFIAIIEKSTDTVCDCQNMGCAQSAMKERMDKLSKYLEVDGLGDVAPRLDDLQMKYCKCVAELIGHEVSNTLNPFPGAKVDVTMNCR